MKTQDNIHFMHYRQIHGTTVDCRGGATLAIKEEGNGLLLIGVARCNTSDVFNKKLGREIAMGRIKSYEKGRYGVPTDVDTEKVFHLSVNYTNGKELREAVDQAVGNEMAHYGYF